MNEADILAFGVRVSALAVWVGYFLTTPIHTVFNGRLRVLLLIFGLVCVVFGGLVPLGIFPGAVARVLYSTYAMAALVLGLSLWIEARGSQ